MVQNTQPGQDDEPTVELSAHELDQMQRECSEFLADDSLPTDEEIAEFWRQHEMQDPFN